MRCTLSVAGLLAGLLFVSCSSDPATTPSTASGTISAIVDGTGWTSASDFSASYTNGIMAFSAKDVRGKALKVVVMCSDTVSRYAFGPGRSHTAMVSYQGDGPAITFAATSNGGSGQVIFTHRSADSTAGTFSFSCIGYDPATEQKLSEVTKGTFSLKFK